MKLHHWCVLLKFFEYYTKILGITSCKHVTIKIIISNMSVRTNWQNIQCIIILVIVNISLNQTQLEINKMFRIFFFTIIYYFAIIFFDLVTLTDPSCTSLNRTWIPSGFFFCQAPNRSSNHSLQFSWSWYGLSTLLAQDVLTMERSFSHNFDNYRSP